MRFLLDAMLPRRLGRRLGSLGHDALHTLDLPSANRTPDREVVEIAERERRVVVTKDADFVHARVLTGRPALMVLLPTGNTSNAELERCFLDRLEQILSLLGESGFVEVTLHDIVVRDA